MSTEATRREYLQAVLNAEIRDIMITAKKLRDSSESAKTSTKKKYFAKKLKSNNEKAMKILMQLQSIENNQKREEAAPTQPPLTNAE